jgi:hypothetical protein
LKKEETTRESYAPTDEVGGVKMKKNEKKSVLQFEKMVFFLLTALFWLLLWLCI